jgi:uroporphyrinogen-III synthase
MAFAVLTRDPASAAAYASELAPLGLEVVAMPVTTYESVAADLAVPADFIAVASSRAAHELARAGVPSGQVWAVGPATQRTLAEAGITAIVPDGVRDGGDLARALAPHVSGKRVLVPRAEDGRPELRDELRRAGAEVIDVIAYRTLPVDANDPSVLEGGKLLFHSPFEVVCVVFAPSQAQALASIVGPLADIHATFVAIGETTAAALRAHGVTSVAVAPTPTPEGIALAVRSVYPRST